MVKSDESEDVMDVLEDVEQKLEKRGKEKKAERLCRERERAKILKVSFGYLSKLCLFVNVILFIT